MVDVADDTTRVSIRLVSGNADLERTEEILRSGVLIRPYDTGPVHVAVDAEAIPSTVLALAARSAVSLDGNPASGNQADLMLSVGPGVTFSLDLYADQALKIRGSEWNLSYPDDLLKFVSTELQDGVEALVEAESGRLSISSAVLGGSYQSSDGYIGRMWFKAVGPGEAGVVVNSVSLGQLDGTIEPLTVPEQSQLKVLISDPLLFLKLAELFGFDHTDSDFDVAYDLDGDGVIGYPDFLEFAILQSP